MVWRTSDLLTNPKCLFPPQTSLSNVRLRDATGYATSPLECSGSHLKVSMSETKCPIIHPAIPPFPSSPTAHHLSQWQLCPSRVYPKTLGIPQGILVVLPSEYIQDKTTFSKSASPGWLQQPQNFHVSPSSSLRLQSDHGNLYLSHPTALPFTQRTSRSPKEANLALHLLTLLFPLSPHLLLFCPLPQPHWPSPCWSNVRGVVLA